MEPPLTHLNSQKLGWPNPECVCNYYTTRAAYQNYLLHIISQDSQTLMLSFLLALTLLSLKRDCSSCRDFGPQQQNSICIILCFAVYFGTAYSRLDPWIYYRQLIQRGLQKNFIWEAIWEKLVLTYLQAKKCSQERPVPYKNCFMQKRGRTKFALKEQWSSD